MAISKRIVLRFPSRLVDRPIVYRLIKDYDLEFNILKALVTPEEEGLLVLELSGQQDDYDKGIRYLTKAGVRIQSLSQDVIRNDERCTLHNARDGHQSPVLGSFQIPWPAPAGGHLPL